MPRTSALSSQPERWIRYVQRGDIEASTFGSSILSEFLTLSLQLRLLPPRGGSTPVNHAITSFDHVRLPFSALLGDLAKSNTIHSDFMSSIWRVAVGSLALSSIGIPFLQMSSYISGRYFQRRHVTGVHGKPVPIISYRTQQLPLLTAISQVFVLKALLKWAVKQFMDKDLDVRARHGVAACCKAVMIQHVQLSTVSLSERLGAQGLFEYNRLSNIYVCAFLPL